MKGPYLLVVALAPKSLLVRQLYQGCGHLAPSPAWNSPANCEICAEDSYMESLCASKTHLARLFLPRAIRAVVTTLNMYPNAPLSIIDFEGTRSSTQEMWCDEGAHTCAVLQHTRFLPPSPDTCSCCPIFPMGLVFGGGWCRSDRTTWPKLPTSASASLCRARASGYKSR